MADADNYPQSSPAGDAIPFDIGYPYGLIIAPIAVAAGAPIELPADAVLAVLCATCACVVSFGDLTPSASVSEGVFLEDTAYIPAGGTLSIQVPKLFLSFISADGSSTGKVYVSLFRAWQSLGKDLLGSNM